MPPAARVSEESGQLQRCIRDLLALGALTAIWQHQTAPQIIETVADALISLLGLEFVYVAFTDETPEGTRELLRAGNARHNPRIAEVRLALANWLGPRLPDNPVRISNPLGPGVVYAVFAPIGLAGKEVLVVTSPKPDFPDQIERLLLSVAVNQAALALQRQRAQQALRESEACLRQLSESLEQRVIERTQQLEAETAERERAEASLRQAQRMESIGQLTGGVAHDFNNLLLVIGGNLELLRRKFGGTGADRQFDAIERAMRRGQSLTRQLLAFSRRQALRPVVVDLLERLPRAMELIRPSLRGDIALRVEIDRKIWAIEVDPGELELALLNLVVNARDALPKGGELVLRGENRHIDGLGAGSSASAGEYVAISLSDTGQGIPAEILPRVFEPFYTTKDIGHGSGLGLSQVYGFVRQSGGTVTINSTVGVGTVVTLLLPRATAAISVHPETEGHRVDEAISGTVLLVEDNEEVAEITTSLLQELGCRTQRAHSARQALEMFSPDSFDLVLTDIVMPGGMTGLDLARQLRDRFPGLPILLTTGYSAAAQDATTERFAILAKPYRQAELAEAIFDLLRRAAPRSTTS